VHQVAQRGPEIWRGLCATDCSKYFYRVAFKVRPNGEVDGDSIRLVETNYPKFRNAVMDAVSKWRYQPIRSEVEEEVVLRLSPF